MTIFIGGKQKRVRRPPTVDGMDVDEFIRRNADPIWLLQNEMWEELDAYYREERAGFPDLEMEEEPFVPGWNSEEKPDGIVKLQKWTPDLDNWPRSWMGIEEDLEYGRKLLLHMEEFLLDLIDQGLSRKSFVQYRDQVWLLGGAIVSQVSRFEEYDIDPLEKLRESVACDGILPDGSHHMNVDELRFFERMCRRFETFLEGKYGGAGRFEMDARWSGMP